MSSGHSSKQYDSDLEDLRSKVLLMAGLVETQLLEAVTSLRMGDMELALHVIEIDDEVNRLEIALDDSCSHLIVKRQPAANDLRTVMATSKVITDLERIGDESTKIARISKNLHEQTVRSSIGYFDSVRVIASETTNLLHDALDMFARLDATNAAELIQRDKIVDHEFLTVMRNLITFMMEDPRTISSALNIMWIAKALERIGDHAKNIAEYVIYIVEGKDIRHSDHIETKSDNQEQV